jgi:hypothetical protein
MRGHPLFLLYGLSLIGLASVAEYRGWTVFRPREVHGVPKSIRDNPGAYRSIYSGYPRYSGGK